MNNPTDNISNQEAGKALDSIVNSQVDLIKSQRPPTLLIFLSSVSYALVVLGYGMTEHGNLWALFMWIGGGFFALFFGLYIYTYRIMGIKVSIIPKSTGSLKMNLLFGILFAILVIASRELRLLGFEFSPHISSVLAGILIFIGLKKHPTGEYIASPSPQEKEDASHDKS